MSGNNGIGAKDDMKALSGKRFFYACGQREAAKIGFMTPALRRYYEKVLCPKGLLSWARDVWLDGFRGH